MKKLFSSIMMAAAALFITSCASDDMTSSHTGEKAEVTFALGLEDGIGTRAISDGTGANYLAYAVFNADGTILEDYKKQGEAVTFPVQKTLTLAKDKTYKIVFWAQNSACTAYTVSDDMKVTVDYAGINNDETRDAFFKTVEFTVKGAAQIDVELQRALAQINVGVTAADWEAAKKSGVTIEKSVAYIKQAATSVDLLTGKASDPVDVTYTENAIPAEDLVVDGETYKWLSMSYILVADGTETGAEKATLNDLGFSFNYAGGAVEFKSGLTSVPVQRNYRTNIVGKLLTGDVNFNITVDNIFADDHAYPDAIEQQLELAAAVGGTVTLTGDVTLSKPLAVNSDMILNLNGNTLTGTISVGKGASLAANGGAVVNTDENVNGITSNGSLTLEDVDVTSARHALRIESGTAVINGGTYKVAPISKKTVYAVNVGDDGTTANVTIKDGTFIGPKGTVADSGAAVAVKTGSTVDIEGGDFSGGKNNTLSGSGTMTVTGGTFDQDPSAKVASGYKSVKNGDKYYVVADEVDAVVNDVTALKDAVKNMVSSNDTEIVIDCGGANVGSLEYGFKKAMVPEGTTVTVKNAKFEGSAYGNQTDGTLVFENCEFSNSGAYSIHFDAGKGTVIFKGCALYGWNSFGSTLAKVEMYNTSLKGNGKYAMIRSYVDLYMEGCDADFTNADHTDVYSEAVEVVGTAVLTKVNCTGF